MYSNIWWIRSLLIFIQTKKTKTIDRPIDKLYYIYYF